jgi:hypothetical protein
MAGADSHHTVAITANTTYVVSTHSGGPYHASSSYFQNSGVDNAPLQCVERRFSTAATASSFYGPVGTFPEPNLPIGKLLGRCGIRGELNEQWI